MNKLDKILNRACKKCKEYWSQYPSVEESWNNCGRGDWMLWLSFNMGISLQELTLAKGRIAKTVVHLMTDERSKKAVEVAIAFGRGEATLEELNAAKVAAYIVAVAHVGYYFASFDAYSQAKDAANQAANACVDFCKIYDVAIYAARAVAADAYDIYHDADSARKKSLQNSAKICREVLTETVFKRLAELREEEI